MSSHLSMLEARLREARSEAPDLPADFAQGVIEAIAREGVSIRPAWRGTLLHWGRRAAGAAVLLVTAALVNAAVYDLRVNGGLELLNFGLRFWDGFLATLPWDLMLSALAAGLAAAFLLRTGKAARVRMAWVLIASYGIGLGGGTALAGTGVNLALHDRVEQGERLPAPMQWFYATRARYRRPHSGFRIGRVISVDNGRALLQTPLGEEVAVTLPPGFKTAPGEHLRLAGVQLETGFQTAEAQRCQAERVRPYFHHARMMQERMRQRMQRGGGMMRERMMKGGGMMPGGGMMRSERMEKAPPPRNDAPPAQKKSAP
ncbi:MAG: hypothetical protein V3S64_13790 [bacterium]